MTYPADFLTVAKAAKALGISERHARRLAGRLPDTCRTEDGPGPMRVSLEELAKLAGKSIDAGHAPDPVSENAGPGPDVAGHSDSDLAGALREIITRQDAEIVYLREALQREQSISMATATDAAELRRKLLSLESKNPSESFSGDLGDKLPAQGGQTGQDEAQASQPGGKQPEALPWYRRIFGGGG